MSYLTIVLEDTTGALAKIANILGDANININEMDAEEIDHNGVMHIGVDEDRLQESYEILRDAGYQVMPQSVLLVQVDDTPGALAKQAVILAEAGVNVRSIRIIRREDGFCLCAIVPEPIETARAVLADKVVATQG